MKFYYLFLIISLFFLQIYAGGPWTYAAGKGYAQISYSIIPTYDQLYGKNTETIQLDREVTDQTVLVYAEYGLSNSITTIIEIPVKLIKINPIGNQNFNSRSLTGIGNVSMSVKHIFYNNKFLIPGQIKMDIPAKNEDEDIKMGLRTGVDAWGLTPLIQVGRGYTHYYAFLETGIRFRSNDYSNEWVFNAESGYHFSDKFWGVFVLDIRQSINTGTYDSIISPSGLYPDNQEYIAFGLKLICKINQNIGINFSAFGGISGYLVARAPALNVGFYYKW